MNTELSEIEVRPYNSIKRDKRKRQITILSLFLTLKIYTFLK